MQTLPSASNNLILISGLFKRMNERTKCAKLNQNNCLSDLEARENDAAANNISRDNNKNRRQA